jgi:putative ABC transport system ATP-binding protein
MIKVENLSMLFSTEEVQTKALNEVTFEIEKGEFVAIMGPSGCGKSTLLNILGTLDTPTSGSYLFEGKRVDKMNENQLTALRKGNIGFIFQSFNLIDELTVYENVELPLVESKLPVGSSASKSLALVTTARAMATRCCCPPDNCCGR